MKAEEKLLQQLWHHFNKANPETEYTLTSFEWSKAGDYINTAFKNHRKVEMDKLKSKCKSLKEQLEKERLEINSDDPYNYVLTNPKGDTFTFNPQKGIGEELNDFYMGILTQNQE